MANTIDIDGILKAEDQKENIILRSILWFTADLLNKTFQARRQWCVLKIKTKHPQCNEFHTKNTLLSRLSFKFEGTIPD